MGEHNVSVLIEDIRAQHHAVLSMRNGSQELKEGTRPNMNYGRRSFRKYFRSSRCLSCRLPLKTSGIVGRIRLSRGTSPGQPSRSYTCVRPRRSDPSTKEIPGRPARFVQA